MREDEPKIKLKPNQKKKKSNTKQKEEDISGYKEIIRWMNGRWLLLLLDDNVFNITKYL